MQEKQNPSQEFSQTQESEQTDNRKHWETPQLRILPVPTKTQGGVTKFTFEGNYTKKS
ncbi:MAG TPA: hypothetical protein VEF04_00590 [Blastocatellia bacterium]|nr:hypothetical protein [Blastocatellia bacterium]